MNFLSKATYFFAIPVLTFGFFAMFFIYQNKEQNLKEYGITGSCQIITVGGINIHFEYTVENQTYSGSVPKPYPQIFKTEYFQIIYNENNPKEVKFLASSPITGINMEYDTILVHEANKVWLRDDLIKFNYIVGDIKYSRMQYFPFPIQDSLVNKTNKVYYRINNPKIGYIVLDTHVLNK